MTRAANMILTDALLWNDETGRDFAQRFEELLKHGERAPTDLVAAAVDVAETLRQGRGGHYMAGETEEEWRRLIEEKAAGLAQLVLDTLTEPDSLDVLSAPRHVGDVLVPGPQFRVRLRQNVVLLWARPQLDGFHVRMWDDFTAQYPLARIASGIGRELREEMFERRLWLHALAGDPVPFTAMTFPA